LTLLGRGRGALPGVVGVLAVGARGGWGSWWLGFLPLGARGGWGSFLWVRVVVGAPSFGCAWWCWGCGAFSLVVGWVGGNVFLLVVSGVVGWGLGFGCGQ